MSLVWHGRTGRVALLPDQSDVDRNDDRIMRDALARLHAGRLEDAEELASRISGASPRQVDALTILAEIHKRRGAWPLARQCLEDAIRRSPESTALYARLGSVLKRAGQADGAAAAYRKGLSRSPTDPDLLNGLGIALMEVGQVESAVETFRALVRGDPDSVQGLSNLGHALTVAGRAAEAVSYLYRARELDPDSRGVSHNLGNALRALGRLDEAGDAFRHALHGTPVQAGVLSDYGLLLRDQGRLSEAQEAMREALIREPQRPEIHANLGLLLLLDGEFETGWAEYEWRLRGRGFKQRGGVDEADGPFWDGRPFPGETLLVRAEQGLGDTLQFVRYLPMVKALGGTVILECQDELKGLLAAVEGADRVIGRSELGVSPMSWDTCVPLLSLPHRFATTFGDIPSRVPYLRADDRRVGVWRERVIHGTRRVGLVWAGRPGHENDHNRSLLLSDFGPLSKVADTVFYSLQKGEAADQLRTPPDGLQVVDTATALSDFLDTAALLDSLDLVITVDTAVAHLAGAMGRPVWVLLPCVPDWRWLLGREDSPWYPGMRLFRQARPGGWEEVIRRVAEALGGFGPIRIGP